MAGPEIGSTANKYTVVAKLATGGMAEIFLARNESTAGVERYVVLKRVLRDHAHDIKFVNMFLDEARLSARLQHPNIAQVYDTGTLGDSYFFTMEYVHGETVRNILHGTHASHQLVPVASVMTIVAGAAAGLQHAHERLGFDGRPLGIVHRDVSPSNLMVSYEGNVKLVDFGVAKAAHRAQETQTGALKGKVGYMSPEQIRGAVVDPRSDLFSLGIVMWELLVGERLFKRAGEFETMEAIVSEPAPPPSTRRPEVSPEIDAIVSKLLQKSPALRYQTAYELLEALDAATMRAGLSLSVSALRRFMRELFGERAEPWVELARHDGLTDVVTVTGVQGDDLHEPHDNGTLSALLDDLRDLSTVGPVAAPYDGFDDESDDESDDEPADKPDDEDKPQLVRAAAVSTTSPTVAESVRARTDPPSASPVGMSPPLAVPRLPTARAVSATPPPIASTPTPVHGVALSPDPRSRGWSTSRRALIGGGVAVVAVLAVVLARGDRTGKPSGAQPAESTPASPTSSEAIVAPAAVGEPARARAPTVDVDSGAAVVRHTVRESTQPTRGRTLQREHAAPPSARTMTSKQARGESTSWPAAEHRGSGTPISPQRAPDPVEVAPAPAVKHVERAKPAPTAKTKDGCDEADPLACRR